MRHRGRRRRERAGRGAWAMAGLAAVLVAAGLAVTGARMGVVPGLGEAVPYREAGLPVAERVGDLMARMSLDDKLGQMIQAERKRVTPRDITEYRLGSLMSGGGSAPTPNTAASWAAMYDRFQRAALATPLGIPLIYGVDAVHGHNNVPGATIFPHNIGLGAARDPELARRIGRAVAEEMAGTGVDWNFAPCVCVARNDRWGRTYESFGEHPELAASMTTMITGMQAGPVRVMATAKHFIADGGTAGGVDQGDARLPERELRALHLPPFEEAVRRGVASVMITYSSWNGAKVHGHRYLVTDLLKRELGFSGVVVSDYNGVHQIDGKVGLSPYDVRAAVNAGIDMMMDPLDWREFLDLLRAEVRAGRVPMARIDDANRRILTKKFEYGLFERPLTDPARISAVGSAAHRALAREAVAKSQVVLKNRDDVLPLDRDGGPIFVAGRAAHDVGVQSGGWTISHQGGTGPITPGDSILHGIRQTAPDRTVFYSPDGSGIDRSYRVAVAVVGERPYAEGRGDRRGAMRLGADDLRVLRTLRASGVPLVVVLVTGRPLEIARELPRWDALVAAWLPGTEGRGVADVLFGVVRPTGRLPVSWMRDAAQQPINDGDGKAPLFPYGFGLTYP